jgi:uncharacterized protein YndB with AHSA1/START domain
MSKTEFVYVTYIAAARQRIWDALIRAEFTRKYWGHEHVSDWKPGSVWEHRDSEGGAVKIVGKVIEFDAPRRLVVTWAFPVDAASPAAHTRVTFELEPVDDMVRLTVRHDELIPGSEMERRIEAGWPRVLSSLKSLLETGKPLPTWAKAVSS